MTDADKTWKRLAEAVADNVGLCTAQAATVNPDLTAAIQAVIECAMQAPADLCGEQREWYNPRLTDAMLKLGRLFPRRFAEAMEKAKDPYGNRLFSE